MSDSLLKAHNRLMHFLCHTQLLSTATPARLERRYKPHITAGVYAEKLKVCYGDGAINHVTLGHPVYDPPSRY